MPSQPLAPALRAHVCDLLDRVGPDAPTLNEGWDARQLAAHLAIRDRRLDALPGIGIPALAGHTKKVQDKQAARPFPETVDLVRQGPPRYNPFALRALDERANLAEYAIHAEDVRRAEGAPAGLPEMPRRKQVDDAIWALLPTMGRLALRSCPVGVTVRHAGRVDLTLKKPTAQGTVVLEGLPLEVLLLLSGRRSVAKVHVQGAPDAVAAFQGTSLSL